MVHTLVWERGRKQERQEIEREIRKQKRQRYRQKERQGAQIDKFQCMFFIVGIFVVRIIYRC
jgi:hypothetical protein